VFVVTFISKTVASASQSSYWYLWTDRWMQSGVHCFESSRMGLGIFTQKASGGEI